MRKVLKQRKGALTIVLLFLLFAFSLVSAMDVCFADDDGDGGIGDPTDPFNSSSPGGGTSPLTDLLILYGAMDLIL